MPNGTSLHSGGACPRVRKKKKKRDRDRESHYIYASADTKLDLLMLIDSLDQIDHEFVIDTD